MIVDERVFSKLISPYDVRDHKLVATAVEQTFPEVYELSNVSVKNQGSTGSCVAHACSSIIEYHNKRQENTDLIFSTEFIYGYRPDGYYVGEGMYIRDALKTLQKIGDCPINKLAGNNKCPEAMENVSERFEELKEFAYPHRISEYVRLNTTSDIKQAILDYGYVIVSMPWHAEYKLVDDVYTYYSDELRGYHAVAVYGWNEKGWLVHNSWGKSWGNNGKFIVPFDFKWTEAWAIIDNIAGENIVRPTDSWFIKTFFKVINKVINILNKLVKKN